MVNIMEQNIVLYALFGASIIALLGSLYACRRVAVNEKTLKELDWETLANLTGEVGAMKRSLQKTNSRISGMTSSDPVAVLSELPRLQAVQDEPTQVRRGG